MIGTVPAEKVKGIVITIMNVKGTLSVEKITVVRNLVGTMLIAVQHNEVMQQTT